MGRENSVILLRRESAVLHLGGELVAPPQAAGLPGPAGDRFADERPVPGAVGLDEALQQLILFGAPRASDPILVLLRRCHHRHLHGRADSENSETTQFLINNLR
ncbi:unnamed protein product [Cuscuta epithymum]|uniref:Uncharacterized protein n=1 Tax=Cuscuta epithymum TaxID=186058 RepID=A0AAV0F8U6_9ASTE|nr:unnamed protein product [Cuscuta epithymum]